MRRNLRNTVAVLVVTTFTALAIFGTVQLSARMLDATSVSSGSAQAAPVSQQYGGGYRYAAGQSDTGQLLTCPATGCTASSCHAAR